MARKETVLSMQDVTDVDVKEVAKETVEVIITSKIIVDEVSTAGGKLNPANEELDSAAPTNITTAQPSEATKTTIDITTPKAKRIVFYDNEESTTRTVSSKSQAKDKGKAKLVKEPEIQNSSSKKEYDDILKKHGWIQDGIFKGMIYEEIRPLFEEEYNKVQILFKEGPEIDVERIKALRKRTKKEKVKKDQTFKKQKGNELKQDNAEKQKMEE
nr:hypothetical protein [Tanacetum cinerariifolium]GEZ48112.1 hypothetical protein [Tanacetum cinerariifolium]